MIKIMYDEYIIVFEKDNNHMITYIVYDKNYKPLISSIVYNSLGTAFESVIGKIKEL